MNLDKIYRAAHVLKNFIRKTDVIKCAGVGNGTCAGAAPGCELYLKTENLQITGSFKVRGAYYKISSLTDDEKKQGVIACSAGNHAQGVALSAERAGIAAKIFIPSIAPISKIEATKKYGAEVILVDGVYDDAYEAAINWQNENGGVFIHPFDDSDVIAGQGTVGLELLEQIPDLDAVVVPVGGGGLASGVAYAIKN